MERGGRQSLERKKYSTAGRLGGRREGEHRPGGLRGLPSPPPPPAFGVGSEGSCLDPANQKSPPPCRPHRPPAAASGKAGLWPADPRRDPFSFLGGRSLVGAGAGPGKDGDSGEARPPLLRCHLDHCKPRGRVCRLRPARQMSHRRPNASEPRESFSIPSSPVPRPP